MLLTPVVLLALTTQDRLFKRTFTPPGPISVVYLSAFADGRLWISGGGRIVRSTPEGKADRIWEAHASSIAPDGDFCWVAQSNGDQRVHLLSSYPEHRFKPDPDSSTSFVPTHALGGEKRTFNLGSHPTVCRCKESGEVIAFAGKRLWVLKNGKARQLPSPHLPSSRFGIVSALTRNCFIIDDDIEDEEFVHMTLATGPKLNRIRIPGFYILAALRATYDAAYVLVRPTAPSANLTLYRIDVPSGKAITISKIPSDYRESLEWGKKANALYVNYADEKGASRVEALTPNGKLLWRSEAFAEYVTGISIAAGTSDIYCVTKAGPTYVLTR